MEEEDLQKLLSSPLPDGPLDEETIQQLKDCTSCLSPSLFYLCACPASHILFCLVKTLVSEQHEWKEKRDSLAVIAHMARAVGKADEVLMALDGLNESFERMLLDEEEKKKQYTNIRQSTELILVILERTQQYRLKSLDLLEFLNGNPELALSLIKSVLDLHDDYEFDIVHAMCRLLLGFTNPDTYFDPEKEKFNPLTYLPFSIAAHSIREFPRIIDYIASFCISCDIFETVFTAVSARFSANEAEHFVMMNTLLSFILNLHRYSSGTSGELRQHLNGHTKFTSKVVIPYVQTCILQWSKDHDRPTAENHAEAGLVASLKILTLCNFRVNPAHSFAVHVRSENFTSFFLKQAKDVLRSRPVMLALLLSFNVNADTMAALDTTVSVEMDTFTEDSVTSMSIRELKSVLIDRGVEYNDCVEKSDLRERVLDSEAQKMPVDCTAHHLHTALRDLIHSMNDQERANLRKAMQQSLEANSLLVSRDVVTYRVITELIDGSTPGASELSKDQPFTKMQEVPSSPKNMSVPEAAKEMANHSPSLPRKASFIETKSPPSVDRATEMAMKTGALEEKLARRASQTHLDGAPDLSPSFKRTSLADAPDVMGSPSKRSRSPKPAAKEEKVHDTNLRRPKPLFAPSMSVGAPKEFLCEINMHVMKDPMRSPSGHVFEKETIMQWIEQKGSLCPLTQEPLLARDLVDDNDLKQRILDWTVEQARKINEDEDEYDIYAF